MIKEVESIPKKCMKPTGNKPAGYNINLLYQDISSAYQQKISKFELVGYESKPDCIIQSAKIAAYNVCDELVYEPADKYVRKQLAKEFNKEDIRTVRAHKYSPNNIIKLHGITLADGVKHIFVEIDFKKASEYKKSLVEPSRKRTLQCIERRRR